MLAIELSIPILVLALLLVCSFAVGFIFRSSQIRSCKKKILELEKEMLNNHAEILELQKERASLIRHMKESKIPVIPMNSKDDNDKRQVK
ncbi:MAG: hypothetical protein J7497_02890 [Chitinophagaceae bacterium]|nr:hypothetical protein [Chitinophagaceae bacterium]